MDRTMCGLLKVPKVEIDGQGEKQADEATLIGAL